MATKPPADRSSVPPPGPGDDKEHRGTFTATTESSGELAAIPRDATSGDGDQSGDNPSPDVMVVDTQDPQRPHLVAVSSSHKMSYSGPMPDPAMLKAYDRICPGSAKQIIRNALN
jgi:hypothetical protein